MLARILSLIAALVLASACTDTRANAYAQALGLKTPHLGFFALDLNPFQEKSPLSPSATKEKTLEIAVASIGRGNYLRARYMDPSRGRFVGMDPFAGNATDPSSLHRYQYANSSPVTFVDPSGQNADLSSTMTAVNATTTSTVTSVISTQAYLAAARLSGVAVGGTAVLARFGPNFSQLASQVYLRGYLALNSHVYSVIRAGGASINDIRNSYTLGANYTARLAQIFGERASAYGLQVHKLIEGSIGAPANVTYSVANMAPTWVRVHQMITGVHGTNIMTNAGNVMRLRDYIRLLYQNGWIQLDKLHLAEAEIWAMGNRLNGQPIPIAQARQVIDQYATNIP